MDVPTVFAQSIAEATRALNQRRSLNETLRMIAEVTRNSVPGFDQVGISTFDKRGKVVAKVAIGDLALGLDEIQYGLGEGPCVETLRGNDVVAAPWLRTSSGGLAMFLEPSRWACDRNWRCVCTWAMGTPSAPSTSTPRRVTT